MPTIVHGFDWPDRFVTGTVGAPGSRTFYLQARAGKQLVSVALEKQQSAALAAGVDSLLDDLMAAEGNPYSIPRIAPDGLADDAPLEQPVVEQFRAGTMTLAWDSSNAQVIIQAVPVEDESDPGHAEQEDPEQVLVVRIPVGAARAFADRARKVVNAGRPICPICDEPIEADGHTCELPDDLRPDDFE
ncbi:MAG: DUF3090 domain-containing protein [Beutenbergiaceae bacterium]